MRYALFLVILAALSFAATKDSGYDSDKDGIDDSFDKCPYEPETYNGYYDSDGCPDVAPQVDGDSDKDGILDKSDKCPSEPETFNKFEDSDGCPDSAPPKDEDSDKDGILDKSDKCPKEPETYNKFQDEDGCPDVLPPTPETPSSIPGVDTSLPTSCYGFRGTVNDFIYPSNSISISIAKLNESDVISGPGVPTRLGYVFSQIYNYPIEVDEENPFMATFTSDCLSPGLWEIMPVYPYGSGECRWDGRWFPGAKVELRLDATHPSGTADFSFTPNSNVPPNLTLEINPASPVYPERFNVTLNAFPARAYGIRNTELRAVNDRGQAINQTCSGSPCRLNDVNFSLTDRFMTVYGRACDSDGNAGTASKRISFTSCYDLTQNGDETGVDCGGSCQACIACTWCNSNITPVYTRGRPNSGKIDIVFVADGSYGSTNFSNFIAHLKSGIKNQFFRYGNMTMTPIPSDYKDKYNFYYYNSISPLRANVSNQCDVPVPGTVWESAPYADAVVLLTEFPVGGGCSSAPPHSIFRAPGREGQILRHEAGHGVFNLVDTYCGNTAYGQISVYPNVWNSSANCRAATAAAGWNVSQCRQIRSADGLCTKDFFRFDLPDNEMMSQNTEIIGQSASRRMNYVFSTWPSNG